MPEKFALGDSAARGALCENALLGSANGSFCYRLGLPCHWHTLGRPLLLLAAILDLSAIPEDLDATGTRLEALFRWLLRQDPAVASFVAAILLMLLGLFVLGYFWSRAVTHQTAASAARPSANHTRDHARLSFRRRRALTQELRRFDDGTYDIQIQVSNRVYLTFAETLGGCFRKAGWQTRVELKSHEARTGIYWQGVKMEGFNITV